MDAAISDEDINQLKLAVEDLALLSRCLDVSEALTEWGTGNTIAGGVAADGLDQARGLVEELVAGDAAALLRIIERVSAALPPPLE